MWAALEKADIPRAFNSCVQPRRRAWTSSGAISARAQASDQEGFGGPGSWATGVLADFLEALESLLLKTRVKKGIVMEEIWTGGERSR